MDPTQRQVIDALVIRSTEEKDTNMAQQAYWRAFRILDRQEPTSRQGINWTSDDDPILTVKQKGILYSSEQGSCKLLLTNFLAKTPVDIVSGTISIEIFPEDAMESDFRYHSGERLLSLTKDGEVTSPLALVDASIAYSLVDLFDHESDPKQES